MPNPPPTKRTKQALICPKCGSVDNEFLKTGARKCNACDCVGKIARFRQGGPKPKNKLDIRDDVDCVYFGSGARRHMPVRYGD